MAPSTIGTLEDTPSFGSKGVTLHVLAVDSKTKASQPITTIFACESSSVRDCDWLLCCASRAVKVDMNAAIEAVFSTWILPAAQEALRFHFFFMIDLSFKEVAGKTVPIVAEAAVAGAVAGGFGGASLTGAGERQSIRRKQMTDWRIPPHQGLQRQP